MQNIISKISSYARTFFYLDFQWRNLVEIIFALSIGILLGVSHYKPGYKLEIRPYIIYLVLIWAFLALLGFFIPRIKAHFTLVLPGPKEPGIPLSIKFKSKGGFIAGRKIDLLAEIVNVDNHRNSKQEFREFYDKFNILSFKSIQLPIEEGKYLGKTPSAGGISIDMEKCQGESTIVFNSPGTYYLRLNYKKKKDSSDYWNTIKEEVGIPITISPAENYISLRNYAITYCLTLIILLLAILQSKII